jgi:peptide deformylase
MLNPEIIGHTGEYESEEECPSLEGKRKRKRYSSIVVTWQDTEMKQRTGTLDGFAAQLVQHAIDHCNGILV